jgi:hypothetical protein
MAKVHSEITPELQRFIEKQPLFFVASAPLAGAGHVNLSPKGQDCLRVLGPQQVGYLDLTGSGNETAAHLAENGRITFMFCAFAGAPRILRLYGTGRAVRPGDDAWAALSAHFPTLPGARQIILADIQRVQTSCGFGVPLMDFVGERDNMRVWATAKGEDGLIAYREEKNRQSLDGLPAPWPAGAPD